MTSGQFRPIEIASIIVNREERHRRELKDINVLSNSIERLGLIHPIVITRELVLVAGERRLAACRHLGHTHINCQYTDELDGPALRAIELEENVKRSNLTWQEECKAIHEYHTFRKKQDPSWSQEKTGAALGIFQPHVVNRLAVAGELISGNERVTTASKYSTALGIVARAEERKNVETILALRGIKLENKESVLNTDFLSWASLYDGAKFNFIHCDFPYGIGADTFNQGAAPTHGGYDDSEDIYWALCECLISNIDRLADDQCHFMFWFSMHHYHETLELFNQIDDIKFDPFPLIWMKDDNVGILPDPQRGPRRIYETCFFGSRGDRKVVSPISNAYAAPTDRSQHMSIKPEPVLRNFFRMFVDESTLMLDPTCGSGSSLRAAESLNARYVLGIEVNQEFAEGANRTLKTSRALRRSTDGKAKQDVTRDEKVVDIKEL